MKDEGEHGPQQRPGMQRSEMDFRDFNDEDGGEQPRGQGISWLSKLEDGKEKYSRERENDQRGAGGGIAWPSQPGRGEEDEGPEEKPTRIAWPSRHEEEKPKTDGVAWLSQKEDHGNNAGGGQRRSTYEDNTSDVGHTDSRNGKQQ